MNEANNYSEPHVVFSSCSQQSFQNKTPKKRSSKPFFRASATSIAQVKAINLKLAAATDNIQQRQQQQQQMPVISQRQTLPQNTRTTTTASRKSSKIFSSSQNNKRKSWRNGATEVKMQNSIEISKIQKTDSSLDIISELDSVSAESQKLNELKNEFIQTHHAFDTDVDGKTSQYEEWLEKLHHLETDACKLQNMLVLAIEPSLHEFMGSISSALKLSRTD